MTRVVFLEALRPAPSPDAVLRTQGVPEGHQVSELVADLVEKARQLYESLAQPRGILSNISLAEFQEVYEGAGQNAVPAPLPGIVEKAEGLALFAATLGEPVCRKIGDLFKGNDPALGCMLDGIASQRADDASTQLGQHFLDSLLPDGEANEETRVLAYSPGYCGWHVSGQTKLFAFLEPGQIDIQLNDSCLMSPLKSVSGVLVAGPPEIHAFDNDFDFCLECATWECRTRIASITQTPSTRNQRSL